MVATEVPSAREGRLIGSNVRLQRLLGQGGMGSVWVAEHIGLQTEVAVKFISPDVAEHAEAVARFQREATAAARLRSPHVVQVFDHGITPDGMPYIVMELLEGEDLAKRIERLGPLPLPEVVAVVAQVAKALAKAHAQGIVHRDIKPDNVFLVDSDGDVFVKVLDFGIAKRSEDAALNMTSTGTMVGTPYYMSPEQVLSSKAVDFQCDLWSLAVVAYNAVTGTLPFVAETLGALCVAISNGTFAAPSELRPELPKALDEWFKRALNRDPTQRFGSARELSDALFLAAGEARPTLANLTGAQPVPALGVARSAAALTPAPNVKPPRKHAIIVIAAGALALTVGALGTALVVGSKKDDATKPEVAGVLAPAPTPAKAPSPVAAAPPRVVPVPSSKPVVVEQKPAPVRRPAAAAHAPRASGKPAATSTVAAKKEADRYGF